MKYMCNKLKKGDLYKDFEVLNVSEIPDFKSIGIYLKHKTTGLEVFHMLNDDEENLFSFSFRTINTKANGAAHILEHSVLCGSEKYPIKDTFIKMSNQSVKTYLNAMTYPDHTVFPASSTVKKDYFNLFSVYADAVFFPRLDKEVFMQEAHRLELNENGEVCIQGVVYNEMKGSYSSFESIVYDCVVRSLFKGSIYEKDSGGDPLEIPSITHEELLKFHDKWYRPDNCFLFLYGNISTEEQLDFIQENFLDRLQKKYTYFNATLEQKNEFIKEFVSYVTPKKIEKLTVCYEDGPAGEGNEKGSTVLVNWNFGEIKTVEETIELSIITGILINHDGSPLQKTLVECGLGEDIAPNTGIDGSLSQYMFTAGLRGVKKGNEQKVYDVIIDCIKNLVEKGISKDDLDAVLMSIEFHQREIKRAHGPYSLRIMNGPISAWMYGYDPASRIRSRENFDNVRHKIETIPNYLENLIKKLFLDNTQKIITVVTPSAKYLKNRLKSEKQIIDSRAKQTSIEKIKQDTQYLHDYQSKESDSSCLPYLRPSDFLTDLENVVEQTYTQMDKIDCNSKKIDLFTNDLNTNGIIYFDVCLPADVLEPKDYPIIPLLCECLTNCGYDNLSWDNAAKKNALHINMMGVGTVEQFVPNTKFAAEWKEKYIFVGRDWVILRSTFLQEELEASLNIISKIFSSVDFDDLKRLQDIVNEMRNDADSTVIPNGHDYSLIRAKRNFNRICAVDEIWNGLTSVVTLHKLAENDQKKNSSDFKRILKALKEGGAVIHATCEKEDIEKLKKLLPSFIENAQLNELQPSLKFDDEQFYELTHLGEENDDIDVLIASSAQIGFAAQSSPASEYGTIESSAEDICSHWLSNSLLWEKLRTIGGAYGAFCDTEMRAGLISFCTYHDPTPIQSCDIFIECLKEAKDRVFSQEELEKAITGAYSRWIQPKTPLTNGYIAFMRRLYGLSDTDKVEIIKNILLCTPKQLQEAFERLYNNAKNNKKAILGPKNIVTDSGFSGKYTQLPI